MDTRLLLEWFGMAASLMVAISLTMQNIKKLRIVNLIGSIVFTVYGAGIHSISVLVLNLFTVGVNIFFLRRIVTTPDNFEALRVYPDTDMYVKRFISFHLADICRFFPSFNPDLETGTLAGTECYFILRGTLPVSLVAFRGGPDSEIAIVLDYAVPAYRDYKSAKFFFESAVKDIASEGDDFVAQAEAPAHKAYLKRMGFEEAPASGGTALFRKQV
jgi:hypothetical protein